MTERPRVMPKLEPALAEVLGFGSPWASDRRPVEGAR
jgi:hypothetical protein